MPENMEKNKSNLVFVNLPSIPLSDIKAHYTNENKLFSPLSMPMGILYLSSYLKKNGACKTIAIVDYPLHVHEVTQYPSIEKFIEGIAEKSIQYPPDIIAISFMFASSYQFYELCVQVLRKKYPAAKIIVGGYQATNCTQYILENTPIDYVLRGEGEFGLLEFVQAIENTHPVEVRGIYSLTNIKESDVLELCDMFDISIPLLPDWDLLDMAAYIHHAGRKKALGADGDDIAASIITSRGCPYHCTFCSGHTVHGKKVRLRSNEDVIQELLTLYKKYHVNLFIPEDDFFTGNKQRILSLLREMKRLIPNIKLQFPNGLNVNSLDNELIDALVDAGMTIANLSVESGSPYVLEHLMKKRVDLQHVRDIVAYLRTKAHVYTRIYIIFGMPHETREQMQESLEYVKTLGADWVTFMIATPLPGAEIYREFVRMNCIPDDIKRLGESHFLSRFFDTPEISANDLNEFAYRANLDVNFIHNSNLQSGRYDRAITQFNDIIQNYPFHIIAYESLRRTYQAMGDTDNANRIKNRMDNLLRTDKRALDMFMKYQDLLTPDAP
jgi:tRNA A37 methylthiotransferase MiaB